MNYQFAVFGINPPIYWLNLWETAFPAIRPFKCSEDGKNIVFYPTIKNGRLIPLDSFFISLD